MDERGNVYRMLPIPLRVGSQECLQEMESNQRGSVTKKWGYKYTSSHGGCSSSAQLGFTGTPQRAPLHISPTNCKPFFFSQPLLISFFFFGILLCFASSFVLLFAQLFLTHKRKFSEHWHKKKRYEHQNDLCTWIVFANSWLIIDTIRKGSFEVIWDGRILCLSKYWPE